MNFTKYRLVTFLFAFLLFGSAFSAEKTVVIGVEAEDFQYLGDWTALSDKKGFSGQGFLFAGPKGAKLPAATAVELPQAGKYYLWARACDFASDRPGTRTMAVSINGKRAEQIFGNSGKESFAWEPGGCFELPAGRVLIGIHDVSGSYGRIDAVVITSDQDFIPKGLLSNKKIKRIKPVDLQPVNTTIADPLALREISFDMGSEPVTLSNEFVRYHFVSADGGNTLAAQVDIRNGDRWIKVECDPAAEIYSVVKSSVRNVRYHEMFPLWDLTNSVPVEVSAGDIRLKTARTTSPPEIWRAGDFTRFIPVGAKNVNGAVVIDFAPSSTGTLSAEWRLRAGSRVAEVKLVFTPSVKGEYSLGYHLFFRKPLAAVDELQLPLAFQRKRLPDRAYTLLDPRTPTPISLAQCGKEEKAVCWAVIGDPSEIPFAWPDIRQPNMGLCINDEHGNVQPSIYGPVPGTPDAQAAPGQKISFTFNVLVQPGEWYAAYRTAVDEIFQLRDYRRNINVSLSDAVFNMIDLIKDDESGGWWKDPKGWYQIESRNTVTHSTPATMLSLYCLTGDRDLYHRRVLPTLEYVLSRGSVHFTPTPHDAGRYATKPMGGPVSHFGTTTYSALAHLTGGFTPSFIDIAFPSEGKVRPTAGYCHSELFDEWAARYHVTHNPEDLKKAVELADEYLEKTVFTPSAKVVGYQPFWLISFVPDWEGLLMMYELTGEKRYLDGAVIGARQLMTGIWTQPLFTEGDTTIFEGGKYEGDPWNGHLLARGPDMSRLGFPLQDDSLKEHKASAWSVSCVGLGFEQPSTIGQHGNRLIYQAVWAPEFLRLARYTGDKAFETYARNAVVGRWGNYPGYYVAGHNDLILNPRYPWEGPDQSVIYYHHIVPHLSWCIDYLVSEAEMLSDGRITFPWMRENGYAYFDGRVYGNDSGVIYEDKDCRLWLNRDVVRVDNPQINVLTAYNSNSFFAVLVNQDTRPAETSVKFNSGILGFETENIKSASVRRLNGLSKGNLTDNTLKLNFDSRELIAVKLDGTRVNMPLSESRPRQTEGGNIPSQVEANLGKIKLKAVAIAPDNRGWDAFVWLDAGPDDIRSASLESRSNGEWGNTADDKYPFEFSIPISSPEDLFQFRVNITDSDGKVHESSRLVLGMPL